MVQMKCFCIDEYDRDLLITAAIGDVAALGDRIKYYWFDSVIVEVHK